MNLLIGVSTTLVVLCIFTFLEKKNLKDVGFIPYFFSLFVIFSAFVFKPSLHFGFWVGFTFLFYVVLEDWISKTVSIIYPILISFYFLFYMHNLHHLLISFSIFLIFLVFSKLTKERILGEGDVYFIFPLLMILSIQSYLYFFLLSCLMGFSILVWIKIFYKKDDNEFAFLPFLFLSFIINYSQFHISIFFVAFYVLSFLSFISLIIYDFILDRKNT